MKAKTLRVILIVWCFFVGLGAVWGAVSMFIDPTGVVFGYDGFFEGFRKLPFYELLFTNLVFPGISLLIVNGLTQLATALLLLRRHRLGARCGIGCGVLLLLWLGIQYVIFPLNPLTVAYTVFGVCEIVTGVLLARKEKDA